MLPIPQKGIQAGGQDYVSSYKKNDRENSTVQYERHYEHQLISCFPIIQLIIKRL